MFDRTMTKEDAESLLECPQLIETLPIIRAVSNARFPIARADGEVPTDALSRPGAARSRKR